MLALTRLIDWHAQLARGLDHLRSALLLATRLWVSWQFLKSGWLKLTNWDVTRLAGLVGTGTPAELQP